MANRNKSATLDDDLPSFEDRRISAYVYDQYWDEKAYIDWMKSPESKAVLKRLRHYRYPWVRFWAWVWKLYALRKITKEESEIAYPNPPAATEAEQEEMSA